MNTQDPRPVVVGADGRPGSDGALRYAVAEARRRGAPLHVVHVAHMDHVVAAFPPIGPAMPSVATEPRAAGELVLRGVTEVVHQLAPGLEVLTELSFGGRADSIVEAAQRAQLLVIGRETRRGLDRLLTGATTAAVASRAKCEVVVVPSFWTEEHSRGHVVVAIKSRGQAPPLLAQAFAEASARQATLTVVTAWQVPDPYLDRIELRTHSADWQADGEAMLSELLAEWRTAYPDVSVETRVAHGPAADVILAASQDSDLLLISRRRHGLPPGGHLGGVAHAVLRRSDVPVAVAPFEGSLDELTPELVLEKSGKPLK